MIHRSTNLIFPPFRDRLAVAVQVAHREDLWVHYFETYRTLRRQGDLYAQGRTAPGPIVTRARPGESWHQYGLAADVAFDRLPETTRVDWTWDGNWKRWHEIVKSVGLETISWEAPHVQLTAGLTVAEAERIMEQDGLIAVWIEVERRMLK